MWRPGEGAVVGRRNLLCGGDWCFGGGRHGRDPDRGRWGPGWCWCWRWVGRFGMDGLRWGCIVLHWWDLCRIGAVERVPLHRRHHATAGSSPKRKTKMAVSDHSSQYSHYEAIPSRQQVHRVQRAKSVPRVSSRTTRLFGYGRADRNGW